MYGMPIRKSSVFHVIAVVAVVTLLPVFFSVPLPFQTGAAFGGISLLALLLGLNALSYVPIVRRYEVPRFLHRQATLINFIAFAVIAAGGHFSGAEYHALAGLGAAVATVAQFVMLVTIERAYFAVRRCTRATA